MRDQTAAQQQQQQQKQPQPQPCHKNTLKQPSTRISSPYTTSYLQVLLTILMCNLSSKEIEHMQACLHPRLCRARPRVLTVSSAHAPTRFAAAPNGSSARLRNDTEGIAHPPTSNSPLPYPRAAAHGHALIKLAACAHNHLATHPPNGRSAWLLKQQARTHTPIGPCPTQWHGSSSAHNSRIDTRRAAAHQKRMEPQGRWGAQMSSKLAAYARPKKESPGRRACTHACAAHGHAVRRRAAHTHPLPTRPAAAPNGSSARLHNDTEGSAHTPTSHLPLPHLKAARPRSDKVGTAQLHKCRGWAETHQGGYFSECDRATLSVNAP